MFHGCMRARDLLTRAAEWYDAPGSPLQAAAARAALGGFASGAQWMSLAMETLRGRTCPPTAFNYHMFGLIKYGLAAGVAGLLWAVGRCAGHVPWLGCRLRSSPFTPSRHRWSSSSRALLTAAARPFACNALRLDAPRWRDRRSDASGYAAGVHDALRRPGWPRILAKLVSRLPGRLPLVRGPQQRAADGWRDPGSTLNGGAPVRCSSGMSTSSWDWHSRCACFTRATCTWAGGGRARFPGNWSAAQCEGRAGLRSLLGGDLEDNRPGLPLLQGCVRNLVEVAPVHAVPGNHDERAGLAEVRAAVEAGGGRWLPDRPIEGPVWIDGRIDPAAHAALRLLCTHHPGDFVAAGAAGYGLVLAGHLHGGQCVLATRRGRLYPAAWIYRWHGLRFEKGGAVLLVSRGAGDTLPVRFNCPREVILCLIT